MDIHRIKRLSRKPQLEGKGTSVMWTDPHISKKLLELHINPGHDIASRSSSKIEKTVDWILERASKPHMKILDLGCGPGLYAELLAQKGHSVTGVDFSGNSIQYAARQAAIKDLDIKYLQQDYLYLDLKDQFDLVIFIYLDFCALLPPERDKVLTNIYSALKKGGLFICDIVNEKNIDRKKIAPSWEVEESGFWKATPYIALNNGYHYPEARALVNQHIIIDEAGNADTYLFWCHYYGKDEMVQMLKSTGFAETAAYEHVLPDSGDSWEGENITFYVSEK